MNTTRMFEEVKAVGSSLLHVLPSRTRAHILSEWLGLNQSNDLGLRWRVAERVTGRLEDWVQIEGDPAANNNTPGDWENVILGVDREQTQKLGGARVVAYRTGRAVTTIGMNQLRPDVTLLQPADIDGTPNPDGRMLAVAMRAGTLLHAAIGIATPDGRQMQTLQTEVLGQFTDVPEDIYRV